MDHTIAQLHAKFNKAHPENQVCASIFYKYRPRYVKTKKEAKYIIGCLCEYCENIELKVLCINRHMPGIFKDVYDISASTMCRKESNQKFHHPDCINRKCEACGVHKLDAVLEPLLADICLAKEKRTIFPISLIILFCFVFVGFYT